MIAIEKSIREEPLFDKGSWNISEGRKKPSGSSARRGQTLYTHTTLHHLLLLLLLVFVLPISAPHHWLSPHALSPSLHEISHHTCPPPPDPPLPEARERRAGPITTTTAKPLAAA